MLPWSLGMSETWSHGQDEEEEEDAPFVHAFVTQLDPPNAHQAQHRPKAQFDEEAVLTHDDY